MKGKTTVLVADEDRFQVKVLKAELEAFGCKVEVAYDGSAAERMAVSLLPDLVILDVTMPMKSGYGVASFLKSYQKTRSIPIILMSKRRASEVDIQLGYKSGATYYLTKPLDKKFFRKAIRTLLKERHKAKPAKQVIPMLSTKKETL